MREPAVLAVNTGSSSLKASLRLGVGTEPALRMTVERLGGSGASLAIDGDSRPFAGDLSAAMSALAEEIARRELRPAAVAHRLVHGGPRHDAPTRLDDEVLVELRREVPFAPLHLPSALDAISAARTHWPDSLHVACFDTAFHSSLPLAARRLPIPARFHEAGVRRYGFHGLSLQSVLLARPDLGDAVIAHLGSGCSVTAVDRSGRSRFTTMSMTPASGMMSATRAGDLDPTVPLYLMREMGLPMGDVADLLEHGSGLAGVSGGPHDMRDLRSSADESAALAIEMFVASGARAIAACATALDDWRTLVFTGGVGEHDAGVRESMAGRLRLGGVRVLVVPADEERVMDVEARALLSV